MYFQTYFQYKSLITQVDIFYFKAVKNKHLLFQLKASIETEVTKKSQLLEVSVFLPLGTGLRSDIGD
jgi:MarR-like DNA-binding transcriptional regulator SgrR of sgrS sRNA